MKKKGFTLIELLVVIAIIAMLMGILMPALARVRALAQRVVCGSNARSIGTALMLYVNDDEDESMPIGYDWSLDDPEDWDRWKDTGGSYAVATISSSLYLLVRGEYTTSDQFICKGEGSTPVDIGKFYNVDPANRPEDLSEAWDFGNATKKAKLHPATHNSYAYQMPYPNNSGKSHPASTGSNSNLAILADLNPYIEDKEIIGNEDFDDDSDKATRKQNSLSHQQDGQNVLYIDGHVKFSTRPTVGVEDDNIYTYWQEDNMDPMSNPDWHEVGDIPTYLTPGLSVPVKDDDSLLLNDEKP
ncbi:MAG: type II secretion system protein [Planctomycetes bacterium]|nr:type II secretion system protein [Planctomycetota bacterium]